MKTKRSTKENDERRVEQWTLEKNKIESNYEEIPKLWQNEEEIQSKMHLFRGKKEIERKNREDRNIEKQQRNLVNLPPKTVIIPTE